jgi:formylglycine-generating enzyme required for sulfatase activity
MNGLGRSLAVIGLPMSLAYGLTGCGASELPRQAETIVTVKTDLPVPEFAGHLRADFYSDQGAWVDSRDIATPEARTWDDLSFSVVSAELDATTTLVRLRTYPVGRQRDYLGERYERPAAFKPLVRYESMADLCASAEAMSAPGEIAVLISPFSSDETCPESSGGTGTTATAAVHIEVSQAGAYRFEINTYPDPDQQLSGFFSMRQDCSKPAATCSPFQHGFSRRAATEQDLDVGTYTLVVAVAAASPAELRLRIERIDEPSPGEGATEWGPRLRAEDGRDITPSTEPQPQVTVDRLLLVELVPGEQRHQTVYLRGDCVGTMARVPFQEPGTGVFEDARTCVDKEGVLEPVVSAGDGGGGFEAGGFTARHDECPTMSATSGRVCIPGGVMLLGDPILAGEIEALRAAPERVVRVRTFWMDSDEVTVGRYREAVTRGLPLGDADPIPNPNALEQQNALLHGGCTWSAEPEPQGENREAYPLSCISWEAARGYCLARGGDLPTEAQWEYVASKAGRDYETAYANGSNEPPGCVGTIFGRYYGIVSGQHDSTLGTPGGESSACYQAVGEYGPQPVAASSADVLSSVGVVGLMGNLGEWVRDAAYPYDHPCWGAASIDEPACEAEDSDYRVVRGGTWASAESGLLAARRRPVHRNATKTAVGFRCAYSSREGSEP